MKFAAVVAVLAGAVSTASAFTIHFQNNCNFAVWPAVGKAPNGQPDTSVAYGTKLNPGASSSFGVDDHQVGIRAWGRTGCHDDGTNCATGGCVGGLTCTDAGLNSGVIVSEFGYGNFGQYGGERTSWDLSHVNLAINLNTRLSSSDGQSVLCQQNNCPDDQAYSYTNDYAADRNSPLGQTFTHTFCA
ncbi:Osmotin, thaumatin-like protein [Gloeophyllum trabeum ATCC 11539]|uniref:Osmotin, thaumatin-like protein n=1 Tax=Gloeophyllum trabeum (strain ATCC 11539 / FP-39264 / Madison 617) TaxID=670483 RepID=S7QL81_GLOTA|nr:Osmotin, thaumatin-like protein [Gloeophyllum trabeum ATCC 11539]EPQ60063.1 Osmotin, thaumatin-like protein [Gloeophyllum trabeum ATCC 11539]